MTTLWLTAGLFHLMAAEELTALARVTQVLAGGDVVSPAYVRRLMEAGCRRFVNGYGPTETTTFACCGAIASRAPCSSAPQISKVEASNAAGARWRIVSSGPKRT